MHSHQKLKSMMFLQYYDTINKVWNNLFANIVYFCQFEVKGSIIGPNCVKSAHVKIVPDAPMLDR